jgi:hypothetical protein
MIESDEASFDKPPRLDLEAEAKSDDVSGTLAVVANLCGGFFVNRLLDEKRQIQCPRGGGRQSSSSSNATALPQIIAVGSCQDIGASAGISPDAMIWSPPSTMR